VARPLRIEYPGAFYHVASRGNERKDIFLSGGDREQSLSYLDSATVRYGARIHVYCLMSNHYHLLVETPHGNLSQIMKHINGGGRVICSKAATKPFWSIRMNMQRNSLGTSTSIR